MNHPIQAFTIIALFFITGISDVGAQVNLSKWQIGFNAGMLVYQGDLARSDLGSYKTAQPVVGLHVSRILNPSFLLRTNLAVGKLYGNDAKYTTPAWRQQRNYKFTTPVAEVSELMVWKMFGNNGNEVGQRVSTYVFGGVGVSFLNVSRDTAIFNYHYFGSASNLVNGLRTDISRNPPGAALILPMGIGLEFYLSPKLSLTAETSFRYTFTDRLDGFSLGANRDKKDFYHSHTIGLLYRFGKGNRLGCPVIKR